MDITTNKVALLQTRLNQPITSVVTKLGYQKPIQDLFVKSESEWERLYPDEAEKLQTHLKRYETRTIFDLGKETVLAWISEDLTALYATRRGRLVKRNGSDANRQFTYLSQTKAQSDLLVSADGGKTYRKVEVTASYTDFFAANGYQSLRFDKLPRMKADKAILLTLDVYANQFYTAEAADLFALPSPGGKFWKAEERVEFAHAILKRNGDEIQILPVEWRQIPEGFWRV
jgi:hypothetical protein